MQNFQIGLIGSGFIAKFFAEAMQQVRGADISAIYKRSTSEELAAFIKKNKLGEPQIFDSIEEVCNHCDAVAILSPNHTRLAVVEEIVDAVKKGSRVKAAICEKPLGRTVAEAQKMVTLIRKAGLLTAYFENQIFMPAINKALEQLKPQQETMGPLLLARSMEEHAGPHNGWFWDPVKQGGGTMSDMGCHSIACARHMLTPVGKPHFFLKPVAIQCDLSLLKWGLPKYRKILLDRYGVDYSKTPAEDFATGTVTFENPETGQHVKAQFTSSWMYDKQGLRLSMEALGPDYAMSVDTMHSPMEIFIGDTAADAIADAETALEKSTASRGLLIAQHNEADLYGYVDEIRDAVSSFENGHDAALDWEYGLEITQLVQAAYLAAERNETLDLTNDSVIMELESYIPKIGRGEGAEQLLSR